MKKNKVFIKVFTVFIALVLVVAPVLSLAPVLVSHSSCIFPFEEVSESEFMRSFRPRLMVAYADTAPDGKDILDNTRYTSIYPSTDSPFSDFVDVANLIQYQIGEGIDFVDLKIRSAHDFMFDYVKQRVVDMVNNANTHNTGGAHRPIQESYAFVAKRKLLYPNSSDYEIDYLYVWYDKNHTNNGTFEGVSLGDFYLQPNSIALMRFNSNGYSTVSYMSADEITLQHINTGDTAFAWYMGKNKYSVINSDGTVESLDYSALPNYYANPCTTYFHSGSDVNSITEDILIQYYNDNTSTYSNVFGDVLTNVQAMFTNGLNDTSYLPSGYYSSDWYISAGGFFPANGSISDYMDGHFSTDTNINPKLAPIYNNFTYNNYLNTGSEITTDNVSNYYDYGVTYDNDTQQFDLDLGRLTAQIESEISPKFQLAFDGVYSQQPDIDSDFTQNTNNYIDIVDKHIEDILKKYEDENRGIKVYWDYPKYDSLGGSGSDGSSPDLPDFEITGFVPDYSNYTSQTLPAGAVSNAKAVADIGWNLFDNLGLIPFIIPLVILGLLWKLTGGD